MCDTLKALQLCKLPSQGSLLDTEGGLSTLVRVDLQLAVHGVTHSYYDQTAVLGSVQVCTTPIDIKLLAQGNS